MHLSEVRRAFVLHRLGCSRLAARGTPCVARQDAFPEGGPDLKIDGRPNHVYSAVTGFQDQVRIVQVPPGDGLDLKLEYSPMKRRDLYREWEGIAIELR